MTSQPPTSTATILLVEDNPGDVRLVEEAFTDADVDATIHTVTDGTAALEWLHDHVAGEGFDLDLILLDLNLPRTDGFEVLAELSDHAELSSVPVLVLTSSSATEDIVRSYELCANAYLTKPNGPDEFTSLGEAIGQFWLERATLPPVPS